MSLLFWRFVEWLQRLLGDPGYQDLGDDMDSLPNPDDENRVH